MPGTRPDDNSCSLRRRRMGHSFCAIAWKEVLIRSAGPDSIDSCSDAPSNWASIIPVRVARCTGKSTAGGSNCGYEAETPAWIVGDIQTRWKLKFPLRADRARGPSRQNQHLPERA